MSCFQSGCRVCSHPTKNNNVSRIQSAVWSCSSEVKRICCVSMLQWIKHGSTTTQLERKDRQLSRQHLVKAVQGDQKLNSGLARLWHPYFWMRLAFCLSTILRQVKPLTVTIAWHYWIDWAQMSRKNGLTCKRKKFCSTKTVLWPHITMAKSDKKTFKAFQLWFCGKIRNRRCRNKYNNSIFQRWKLEKHRIPVIEGSAVVHNWRNVSIVKVDYWWEWDTTTFYLTSANGESLHCLQWQVHDVFLVFIAEK